MSFDDAQVMCGGLLDGDSFYARLGELGHNWIRDQDYAVLYDPKLGRACVPPSILVRSLLLQHYRACSDRELVERIRFDLRYKVALGVAVDYPGFDPSLLSIFRARLILHEKESSAFERTLEEAKKAGLVGRTQAVDSMPIIGAAALQDTYTLIRTGIEKLLAAIRRQRDEWGGSRGFKYPFKAKKYRKGSGMADIDWSDKQQRQLHLNELVQDASALIGAVEASKMAQAKRVQSLLELLKRILAQDIERDEASGLAKIKKGGQDRILSTNDPDARHGRKTSCRLIKGYKCHVTVSEDEIVTSVAVTAANAPDTDPVPAMVKDLQARDVIPKELQGDCAYGGADFRAEMEEKGIQIMAKVPQPPTTERFPKTSFTIDLSASTVTCPAGQTTSDWRERKDQRGRPVKVFRFDPAGCSSCPLRGQCIGEGSRARELQLHYNEGHLQKARQKAAEPGFREALKKRLVVERVQGRLQSYGLKNGRYFGLQKILLQATLTVVVNNIWRLTSLPARGAP